NANLQNANLWSANLQEANLRSVNLLGTTSLEMCNAKDFTGSIVSYSDKHADKEKWHQFKEKGGIILYTESGEDTNQDHVDLDNKRVVITGKNGQGIFYYLNLPITINLPETQQENPDWEISIEDI
ncbi:MAG: pentapeptide repeat-containing protein, partial [Neisseria sp.]|uniref:pentapeptide repeat-containing protein n=1 Tax=Neisseria sp. TaxID=192066 RepID=UPI0026DB029D